MGRYLLHRIQVRPEVAFLLTGTQTVADGGNTLHAPLNDGSHCAAVMHTATGIVAVIDTRYDKVGLAGDHLLQGQFHTVGRRSGAGVNTQVLLLALQLQPYRHNRGNGAGRTGACTIRCNHDDLAQLQHTAGQHGNALCAQSVVICY